MSAARFQNNPAVFATLLRAGANPNARSGSGNTSLHVAATWLSNPKVISVLIEGGADPNARIEDDSTPLHGAAWHNRNPAVSAALIRAGANPRALNKYGKSPLGYAQKNKNPAVARLLKTGVAPDGRDNSRLTPTARASETRDRSPATAAPQPAGPPPPRAIREAQALMAALGYKPGPADGRWGPRTGRAYAAFLRDRGMPPSNILTPDVLRAMRDVAKGRNVAAGAASTKESSTMRRKAGRSSVNLHRLVAAGDVNRLKAALNSGSDVNSLDGGGQSVLMLAVNVGRLPLVETVLNAKPNPDLQARDGATALFMAAVLGHSNIFSRLLEAGANPKIKGPKGMTAVEVARQMGHKRILELPRVAALMQEERLTSGPKCRTSYSTRCWTKVSDNPLCHLWKDGRIDGKIITWSGRCRGGIGTGTGTLTVGKKRYKWSGSLVNGKRHGQWAEKYVRTSKQDLTNWV